MGLIPGLGRSPGGGHGNPLQYPCLENPMDRGAWLATIHSVAKSGTRLKQLSTHTWGRARRGVSRTWSPGESLRTHPSRQNTKGQVLSTQPHHCLLHWRVGSLPLAPPGKRERGDDWGCVVAQGNSQDPRRGQERPATVRLHLLYSELQIRSPSTGERNPRPAPSPGHRRRS